MPPVLANLPACQPANFLYPARCTFTSDIRLPRKLSRHAGCFSTACSPTVELMQRNAPGPRP